MPKGNEKGFIFIPILIVVGFLLLGVAKISKNSLISFVKPTNSPEASPTLDPSPTPTPKPTILKTSKPSPSPSPKPTPTPTPTSTSISTPTPTNTAYNASPSPTTPTPTESPTSPSPSPTPSYAISVNTSSFTSTISRSSPTQGGYIYGSGFTFTNNSGSTINWQLDFGGAVTTNVGLKETSGSLGNGYSYSPKTFINPSLTSNGTYSGSVRVSYYNGGWHSSQWVGYSIIVTN